MSWFKIDDQSPFHPKVIAAGNEAWGAFCRMGAWSASFQKEGFVSEAGALAITTKKVLRRLVDAGLLHEEEGGYRIHDYLEYNPTAEQEQAKKQARAEAGRIGGRKSGISRNEAKHEAIASANGKQNRTPSPSPSPSPNGSNEPSPRTPPERTAGGSSLPPSEKLERAKSIVAAALKEFPHWEGELEKAAQGAQFPWGVKAYRCQYWRDHPDEAPKPPRRREIGHEIVTDNYGSRKSYAIYEGQEPIARHGGELVMSPSWRAN